MKNTRAGFTLVEVMIVTAVSALIIFGAFNLLRVSGKHLDVVNAKMNLQEGAREALFKMAQEIRQTAGSANKIEDNFTTEGCESGMECTTSLSFLVPTSLVGSGYTPNWAWTIEYSLGAWNGIDNRIIRTSVKKTDPVEGVTCTPCAEDATKCCVTRKAVLAENVTSLIFSRKSATPEFITMALKTQRTLDDGRVIPELQMTMQAEARNP